MVAQARWSPLLLKEHGQKADGEPRPGRRARDASQLLALSNSLQEEEKENEAEWAEQCTDMELGDRVSHPGGAVEPDEARNPLASVVTETGSTLCCGAIKALMEDVVMTRRAAITAVEKSSVVSNGVLQRGVRIVEGLIYTVVVVTREVGHQDQVGKKSS